MIARYTRPELGALWSDEARMESWREVELAACEELPALLGADGPSEAELEAIRGAAFTVAEVAERERVTEHDVAAFVDVLAASVGPAGRWIHFGLTSSDVLDTALALQLRAAGEVILAGARALERALAARAREHADTLCVGRTHGVHAEPTSFGDQARGLRVRGAPQRRAARARVRPGRRRRAVGRGRHIRGDEPGVRAARARAPRRLRARTSPRRSSRATATPNCCLRSRSPAPASSALRPRSAICSAPRCARLQEPFRAGQKGSSAMPHKRNPIKSEQISGLARVLRGNAQAALENVALWHERDISHSSVERVILPDSTILIDYLQHRTIALVQGMTVDAERMRANLELTHGALFSQRVLLALVEAGSSRDRRLPRSCRSSRNAPGMRASRCASCSPRPPPRPASTSTRSSTTATTRAIASRSSRASTRSSTTSERRAIRLASLVASRHVRRSPTCP